MSCVTASETLYKQPSEKRKFSMDFSNLMVTGETIAASPAPVITSEFINGNLTNLTITLLAISGQTMTFWVAGGTNNRRYRLEIVITTSTGQILSGDGILSIKDK